VAGRSVALPILTAVVEGLVADAILERTQASRADLVVMTTHGRGPVGRFFLGGVADEVVRRSGAPVLLVPAREPTQGLLPEPTLEKVVVALDGSALAEQALEPALELAHLMEARCILLRVVESQGASSGAAGEGTRSLQGPEEAEAQAYLEQVARRLRKQGVAVEIRVLRSRRAAEAIREQAQGRDLIALATHGRSGVRRLVLGSVADKIIRGGTTPVLMYRPLGGSLCPNPSESGRAARVGNRQG
jgi:nucleotide-binding universal stress UspA family protein